MPRPSTPPIGLPLGSTAQAMSRAFDDALAAAGSLPSWLVLISPKIQPVSNQRALAEAVGIQGATLTHHLNAMEQSELITHRCDPANRRVHVVQLAEQDEATFGPDAHRRCPLRPAAAGRPHRRRGRRTLGPAPAIT
jgi:MarR family transcriptional regulator for hemolysin